MAYEDLFGGEVGELIDELGALGYWHNQTSNLWLRGRMAEVHRLRESGSPELAERLRFFAMVFSMELERIRGGASIP